MAMRRGRQQYPRTLKQARAYNEAWGALCGPEIKTPTPSQGSEEKTPPRAKKAASKVPRGTRKVDVPPEWREQAALVEWMKWQPYIKKHIINIRNEGRRTHAQANVAKMMGLRKGASDLFIARPHNGKCGLFLEMKENREYADWEKKDETWIAQEEFILLMRESGFDAHFSFGCDQGIMLVRKYLGLID
jgi:hypothetical protein